MEPRAWSLLCLLVENHDRLVTKDEIIEKIWDGQAITQTIVLGLLLIFLVYGLWRYLARRVRD